MKLPRFHPPVDGTLAHTGQSGCLIHSDQRGQISARGAPSGEAAANAQDPVGLNRDLDSPDLPHRISLAVVCYSSLHYNERRIRPCRKDSALAHLVMDDTREAL